MNILLAFQIEYAIVNVWHLFNINVINIDPCWRIENRVASKKMLKLNNIDEKYEEDNRKAIRAKFKFADNSKVK